MTTQDALDGVEREVADRLFELQPTFAVALGRHEYDGRLPDYSTEATDRWAVAAQALLDRLTALDTTGWAPDRQVDHFLLRLVLEGAIFDLRDAQKLDRNPMTYLGVLSLSPYLGREYAPAATR